MLCCTPFWQEPARPGGKPQCPPPTGSQLRAFGGCLGGKEAGTAFHSPDKVLILSVKTQQGGPGTGSRET